MLLLMLLPIPESVLRAVRLPARRHSRQLRRIHPHTVQHHHQFAALGPRHIGGGVLAARRQQIHVQLDIVAAATVHVQHLGERHDTLAEQRVLQEAGVIEHLEDDLRAWRHQHGELVVPLGQVRVLHELGLAVGFVVVHVQLNVRVRLEDAIVAQRRILDGDGQLMEAAVRAAVAVVGGSIAVAVPGCRSGGSGGQRGRRVRVHVVGDGGDSRVMM